MAVALLLGNGINRLNNRGMSWKDVLHAMMAIQSPSKSIDFIDAKPFALVYEEILLASAPKTGETLRGAMIQEEMALKRLIAEQANKLAHNGYHSRIMNSGVKHILTTNYDYTFERATGAKGAGSSSNQAPESKYSVFRRRTKAGKFIWHIHGEARAPNSITLGYDQYSGYVQKLRAFATAERNSSGYGSPFKVGNVAFDDAEAAKYSWLDVFFRDDVHIIGLGLDYTEIDLWWALTYKGRLGRRGLSVGETHFHGWHQEPLKDDDRAKHSMLRALGVQVHLRQCSSGFETAYDEFIKDILHA